MALDFHTGSICCIGKTITNGSIKEKM